ncbi:MAG TPA: Lrp/AsnC family transcriptional regulator [Ilumatobacteraceae bacterium]|nr:Lrp/AsnC family transcriptional regulator [Ilumatobacteraceae bacterium]
MTLDSIDKRIIAELQRDGRMSYADLAPMIGLSPAATRQRVQRLTDSGVLQVVAVTDPLALGYHAMAMFCITVERDAESVADSVGALPAVIYSVLSAGGYDLFAEVLCATNDELFEVLNDVRTIPGVREVRAFPYFRIHTHRFSWGVR